MFAFMRTGAPLDSGGAASNDPKIGHSIWSGSGATLDVSGRVGVTPALVAFDWVSKVAAGQDLYPVAPLYRPAVLRSFSPPPLLPGGGDLVVHCSN